MDVDRVMLDPESSYTTQDHFLTIATVFCNREILNLFGREGMVQDHYLSNGRWMGSRMEFYGKNSHHGLFCTSNTTYISYKSSENMKQTVKTIVKIFEYRFEYDSDTIWKNYVTNKPSTTKIHE